MYFCDLGNIKQLYFTYNLHQINVILCIFFNLQEKSQWLQQIILHQNGVIQIQLGL